MYLVSMGSDPFTVAEIREALGLRSLALDLVIAAGINLIATLSRQPVRTEVWAIATTADVYRYGIPETIGAPYRRPGADTRLFRDCTYAPDPAALARAFKRTITWCENQDDITLLRARELAWPTSPASPVSASGNRPIMCSRVRLR